MIRRGGAGADGPPRGAGARARVCGKEEIVHGEGRGHAKRRRTEDGEELQETLGEGERRPHKRLEENQRQCDPVPVTAARRSADAIRAIQAPSPEQVAPKKKQGADGEELARQGPDGRRMRDKMKAEGNHLDEEEPVYCERPPARPEPHQRRQADGESGPGIDPRASRAEGQGIPPRRPAARGFLVAEDGVDGVGDLVEHRLTGRAKSMEQTPSAAESQGGAEDATASAAPPCCLRGLIAGREVDENDGRLFRSQVNQPQHDTVLRP